jgi:hypothetical protein
VGLEEADRQEQRPIARAPQDLHRQRRDRLHARRRDLHHLVVADRLRLLGDVLLADQGRGVAGTAQHVDDVMAVVAQRPSPMREAEHAVALPVLAGQQARTAGRAGGRRAECLAEEDALVGERLHVRHRHRLAVGLDVAAGVVRVQVEDVRSLSHGIVH